jgi:hypothetical protein
MMIFGWHFGVVGMGADCAGQMGFFLLPAQVEVSSPSELLNPVSVHKLASG